jgi:hypothetical protein
VYVRPFPNVQDQRVQVSSGGAAAPVWGPDGRELFYYAAPGMLNSAYVRTSPSFAVDSTVQLFPEGNFVLNNRHARYAVSPDGQRFILAQQWESDSPSDWVFVQNLISEIDEKLED